jgi:hypothetical protein
MNPDGTVSDTPVPVPAPVPDASAPAADVPAPATATATAPAPVADDTLDAAPPALAALVDPRPYTLNPERCAVNLES